MKKTVGVCSYMCRKVKLRSHTNCVKATDPQSQDVRIFLLYTNCSKIPSEEDHVGGISRSQT